MAQLKILFDREYTGPRWRYGAINRDPAICGFAPKGWIVHSKRPSRDFQFGTIDYPFELSEIEISNYELEFVCVFVENISQIYTDLLTNSI